MAQANTSLMTNDMTADEYVQVCRALWERSWEDDAVVRDAAADVFADPAKVHEMNYSGRWLKVSGPYQCEPSPQRTPVLYQAGASARGIEFAARHAEVMFAKCGVMQNAAAVIRSESRCSRRHSCSPEARGT